MIPDRLRTPAVLRRVVAASPTLYRCAVVLKGHGQLVRPGDDLVIDGFPRSANSSVEAAFRLAQKNRPLRLAHHCHAAAQFLIAETLGIPAILLLRAPDDAVLSAAEAFGDDKNRLARFYRDYIAFHRPLLQREGAFVIAPFDEVTRDFGPAVRRVNRRFGTSFSAPDASKDFALRAAALRDQLSQARTGRVPRYSLARDSMFRDMREYRRTALAEAQRDPKLTPLRRKAQALYTALMARHLDDLATLVGERQAA